MHVSEVGDLLGLEKPTGIADVQLTNVDALLLEERHPVLSTSEVFTRENRNFRRFREANPCIRELGRQRIFDPQRLDRLQRLRKLDSGEEVVVPLSVEHDVAFPADRLADVLEPLLDVDQLLAAVNAIVLRGPREPVRWLLPGRRFSRALRPFAVAAAESSRRPELEGRPTGLRRLHFGHPITAARLVEHVARTLPRIHAHLRAEGAAQERSTRAGEPLRSSTLSCLPRAFRSTVRRP